VSEARVECTFLANDAAYLTLSRAVTQLRRSEIVTPGVGLTVRVVCGVSNESVGFGRAFSLQSQSECIMGTAAWFQCCTPRPAGAMRSPPALLALALAGWAGTLSLRAATALLLLSARLASLCRRFRTQSRVF